MPLTKIQNPDAEWKTKIQKTQVKYKKRGLTTKKSEMFFFYSVKDIEQVTGIDVVAENKTLDEILSEVLKNTGITYEVTHNTVVLRKGKGGVSGGSNN